MARRKVSTDRERTILHPLSNNLFEDTPMRETVAEILLARSRKDNPGFRVTDTEWTEDPTYAITIFVVHMVRMF